MDTREGSHLLPLLQVHPSTFLQRSAIFPFLSFQVHRVLVKQFPTYHRENIVGEGVYGQTYLLSIDTLWDFTEGNNRPTRRGVCQQILLVAPQA